MFLLRERKSKKNQVTEAPAEVKKPDAKKEPKPYKKVIDTTAVTQNGLIDVHKVGEKYLFEISDSLIGKEIMTITRYSKLLLVEEYLVVKKLIVKLFALKKDKIIPSFFVRLPM